MTFNYQHLTGLPFEYGRRDCFALVRDFYNDAFGIEIKNYARPTEFWMYDLDLYQDNAKAEGFQLVSDEKDLQYGDVILMSIKSPKVANHSGIYVGNTRILHHFLGQLSKVDTYGGVWRNTTVAVYRHPSAVVQHEEEVMDVMELLPPQLKRRLDAYQSD